MNRKVLKTMIALVVVFLVACYVLKIFFPEQFVISIENKIIVKIGDYITNNAWADYLFGILSSFTTYWLFLCAVCRKWYLKWYEIIIVLIVIIANIGFSYIDMNLYTALSYSSFVFLTALFGAKLKPTALVYVIHLLGQSLSLSIRDILIYMTNINVLTIHIVGIESLFWLILFYFYYNYKKEKQEWDGDIHQCTETKIRPQPRLQKSTKRLHLWNKIKQFISNKFQKSNIKKFFRKAKLRIKDFIIDELWIYLIVIGSIVLCSWLFNRWIEGLMFCIAHFYIRKVFDKQFHFSCTAYCLTLTLAITWFAIPITLPLATSLLSSIPIAFGICFVGFVVQDRVDLMLYKKKHEMFNLKTCTKEQLVEACNILGYNNEKQELAIMFFIDKLSNKDIWRKLCELKRNVEIETIKTYKYRMKQDFNSLIKTEE